MANEPTRADRWIYGVLSVDSTILSLVSTRIYNQTIPSGAIYPCIMYQFQYANRDLITVGSTRVWADMVYLVRGIVQGEDYNTLENIADRIDVLLHGKASQVVSNGTVVTAVRIAPFKQDYETLSLPYRHLGGLYRLQVKAT